MTAVSIPRGVFTRMLRVASAAAAIGGLAGPGVAGATDDAISSAVRKAPTDDPRVRAINPHLRSVLALGIQYSPTFAGLVESIAATDGIVYVEEGRCGHGVRSCLTHTVSGAAGHRILRIVVDIRPSSWDLIASIGHELQHALEVLQHPDLTTSEAIYLFYSREATTLADAFETRAAIRIGSAVSAEVQKRRKADRRVLAAADAVTAEAESPPTGIAFQ